MHLRVLLTALFSLTCSATAAAQVPAPTAPASSPVAAPIGTDLVRLKDGSEWRGTIVERVAQSHVVLVIYTGEAKRFEESALVYAGPAASVPQNSPPPAVVPATAPVAAASAPGETPRPPGTVRLALRPSPKASIYLDDGRGLTRACENECMADVPPGTYRTGLGRGDRAPIAAPGSFEIREDDILRGVYESRRGFRIAGGVILGVGSSIGLSLLGVGIHQNNLPDVDGCETYGTCSLNDDQGTATIVTGAMIAVASAITGAVLLTQKDKAVVRAQKAWVDYDEFEKAAATAKLEPAALPLDDRRVLETSRAQLLSCWQGEAKPANAYVKISAKGETQQVLVRAEGPWSVRACMESVLLKLTFSAGKDRFIDYTF